MDALSVVLAFRSDGQSIPHVNALDYQHPILGLDLPYRLDFVSLRIDVDLTRLQRAGKRARQSPSSCRNDVVERGRVRRVVLGPHSIVLGNLGMNPENHRLTLGR
jgi:hypothetical protein